MDQQENNKVNEILPKPDYILFIVTLFLLSISLYDANYAFLIGIFGIPTAFILFVRRVNDKDKRSPLRLLLTYGGILLLTIAGPSSCVLTSQRVESSLAPVITQLDNYFQEHGTYPKELTTLDIQTIPVCPDKRRVSYHSFDKGKEYSLTCVTYAFNKYSYSSVTRQWENWD